MGLEAQVDNDHNVKKVRCPCMRLLCEVGTQIMM